MKLQTISQTRALVGLLTFAVVLSACAPTPTTAAAPPADQPVPPQGVSVTMDGLGCPSIEARAGVPLTWINNDSQVRVVRGELLPDGSRLFDSGELAPGSTFTFVFTEAGDFPYHCLPEEDVKLRVIVVP